MDDMKISLSVPATIYSFGETQSLTQNKYVTQAKLKVFYIGKTGDNRVFTKQFSDQLLQTLPGTPVVAYYDEIKDDFVGHNHVQYVFGYVPEAATIGYAEENGNTFAITDVLLFTGRNDNIGEVATKIIGKSHSLELDPGTVEYTIVRANKAIESITFTKGHFIGLSVLGDNEQPAFAGSSFFIEDSEVKTFVDSFQEFKKEVELYKSGGQLMNEENNLPVQDNEPVLESITEAEVIEIEAEVSIEVKTGEDSIEEPEEPEAPEAPEMPEEPQLPTEPIEIILDPLQEPMMISQEELGSKPALQIDGSEEAMSMTPWGNVDKAQLVKDVLMASNYETIAPRVYMKLTEGWMDGIEGACQYPVMELQGDLLVYNRYGLAAAMGYAQRNNETEVISKVNNIYDELDLEMSADGEMAIVRKRMRVNCEDVQSEVVVEAQILEQGMEDVREQTNKEEVQAAQATYSAALNEAERQELNEYRKKAKFELIDSYNLSEDVKEIFRSKHTEYTLEVLDKDLAYELVKIQRQHKQADVKVFSIIDSTPKQKTLADIINEYKDKK